MGWKEDLDTFGQFKKSATSLMQISVSRRPKPTYRLPLNVNVNLLNHEAIDCQECLH
jgi:hypothetical protein